MAICKYFLQVWDLYSDCIFAYQAYKAWRTTSDSKHHNLKVSYLFIFILSTIFIIVPWTMNNITLFIDSAKIHTHISANIVSLNWYRSHYQILSYLTALSGGLYPSIIFCNSYTSVSYSFIPSSKYQQ